MNRTKLFFDRQIIARALTFFSLAIVFFLIDALIDGLTGHPMLFDWPRLMLFFVLTVFCFIFYMDAVLTYRKTEIMLNKGREEMEMVVLARTAELQEANRSLQNEISERERVERERELIFNRAEFSRQQAQLLSEELQLANSMFRALVDTMPVGVVMTDSDGIITLANQLARVILGNDLAGATETLKGNCVVCRMDGSCYPAEELPLNRAIQNREMVTNVEALLWKEDGSKTYILMSASPVYEETGLIINAVQIVQDITDLKRMEQRLRESEERYRTQFDIFPEPNTVWDRNGNLLMQNLVSARNLAGQRQDFIGKSILQVFGPQGQDYLDRIVKVIDSGQSETQEDVVDLPAGRSYFQTTMQRIQNPDGQYAVQVMSYDITERIQAEEALRASEDKFSTVFHFSPDAIVLARLADTFILDVNEAFVRMLGYPRATIVGQAGLAVNMFADKSQLEAMTQAFKENGRVVDFEVKLVKYDGGVAYVLMSLITLQISGEMCVLTLIHDITKRKLSEFELLRVQRELARGAEERAAIKERQRLARELHDSVSQALYGISLGAHTALAHLDGDRNKTLEAMTYVISLAQAGLAEMRALIFELRPESLELEGLVMALSKQAAALRARYALDLELNTCEEPDLHLSVKEALYRVALEALHNAVKHARCSRLVVKLICLDDEVELSIQDNGVGFDPHGSYPGHLGLHSMEERAQKVGGTLSIESSPGSGARVKILIPAREPQTVEG